MIDATPDRCEQMAKFRLGLGALAHKAISPDYYRWKLLENPFDKGGLYLEERNSDIAGSASVTPKHILVHGSHVRAFEIGDTYTNPSYQRQGVFVRAVAECTAFANSRSAAFIYGTPNEASLTGYVNKAGYSIIPGFGIGVYSKRISRHSYQQRISETISVRWLAKALSIVLDQGERVRIRLSADLLPWKEVCKASQILDVAGAWGTRTSYAFYTLRDSTFLAWRYFANPERYKLIYAMRSGKPVGFIVTKTYLRGEMTVGVMCDFVAHDDDPMVSRALFRTAEETLRLAGCDFLETWCSSRSPYAKELRRFGFKEVFSFPVIINQGCERYKELMESNAFWHYTLGDSDNI